MQSLTNLTFDFSFGSFELIYDAIHKTDEPDRAYRRGGKPHIQPFAFPLGSLRMRTFVSECMNFQSPPNWYIAGTLVQFIETNQVPATTSLGLPGLAIHEIRVPLNRQKLHVLEKVAHPFEFGFEPVPWLKEFHLKLWRWNGSEREEILDELADIQGEIETIQETLDGIKTQTNRIP